MQDQYEDIGAILAKYPTITLEEDTVLKDWIHQSDHNRRIFEELSASGYLNDKIKRVAQLEAGKRSRWLRLFEAISSDQPNETGTVVGNVIWWNKWRTYVAAASIVLIACVMVYILRTNKQKDTIVQTPNVSKVNDVKAGQYKAKLTLNDGTTIVLDSAKDGRLVQQDGTSIIYKDGKLVYEKGGKTNKVLYNTLSTSKAQTYATVLSDGTKVWLNSESSIHYPVVFNANIRKVEITGEAYFEVAPASGNSGKRPFIVSANGMEIEVLGTHFNTNSYTNEPAMKTTLLEGKVAVRSTTTNEQTVLVPGEQAILSQAQDDKAKLDKTKDVDLDAEVAWRFGLFNFNNADLQTMMRQLERWYDVQVEYQGEVPNIKFYGEIPRELSLSQVLSGLQRPDVHFKMVGKKIIVTP